MLPCGEKMKFTRIPAPDFDLQMTLDSGQVFHWEKAGRGFMGTIGDFPVYVEQRGDLLTVRGGDLKLDGLQAVECSRRILSRLFRAGSSARRNLRVISEGSAHECCPRFLSRVTDHSSAEVGMSGHVHLFIDETGGAHSSDFAGAAETLR